MAEESKEETETWGRRSRVRMDELPRADPIAYLGTERHPIGMERHPTSVPPMTRDVEPARASMRHGAEAAKKSHVSRRLLAAAIGFAIIIPMAVSLSTSDDTTPMKAVRSADTLPHEAVPAAQAPAAQATEQARTAPSELPPGGVSERALSEAEPPMTADKSVADWVSTPQKPASTATDTSHTTAALAADTGNAAPVAQASETKREPALAATLPKSDVRAASAALAPNRQKNKESVGSFPTPFDFTAAMNAIAAKSVGPSQCGLAAVGPASVAITFAPTGHATRAVVENGPLKGTEAGSCVALRLRETQIAPFDGDDATVRTTVLLR